MSRRGGGPVTVLNVAEKLLVAKSCKWHSCNPADLYQAPVMKHVPEEEEARRSDWLVLWLDCDREGENTAFEVVDEIDLRIGASFTRFQTMLLKDRFSIDSTGDKERSRVISYGPCQFPTLGFIVERYWEIQAHEPEEFWTINCSHESEDGLATKAENNLNHETKTWAILENLKSKLKICEKLPSVSSC
ncbi:hypothetical protein Bca52824_034437 [Brassica carinata]|uniref:DNA topoisomerase n=1 Tax=Brassica carinata TaxID=52824 RepID=A0A8X7S0X3_BRACI|nr:hypothetical protein Bca52824_034437 [Brassica carinata]